jgi:hypothetical protein
MLAEFKLDCPVPVAELGVARQTGRRGPAASCRRAASPSGGMMFEPRLVFETPATIVPSCRHRRVSGLSGPAMLGAMALPMTGER